MYPLHIYIAVFELTVTDRVDIITTTPFCRNEWLIYIIPICNLYRSQNVLQCKEWFPQILFSEPAFLLKLWLKPFFDAFWLVEKTIENAQ